MKARLMFIGPGRLGLALGYALFNSDAVERIEFCGRRPQAPSHPLFNQGVAGYTYGIRRPDDGTHAIFLTVPDDAIPELAAHLAAQGDAPPGCSAFHVSGALSTDALEPLYARGYSVGSIHPMQTVADSIRGAELLRGAAFAISGEPEAIATCRRLLSHLTSTLLSIPHAKRPIYHAAGVFASNYLATLIHTAADLLIEAGVDPDDAFPALLPLLKGTLENIESLGLGPSLTGPIVRDDRETVALHRRALDGRRGALYAALGRELVHIAYEADRLDPEGAEELIALLDGRGNWNENPGEEES